MVRLKRVHYGKICGVCYACNVDRSFSIQGDIKCLFLTLFPATKKARKQDRVTRLAKLDHVGILISYPFILQRTHRRKV